MTIIDWMMKKKETSLCKLLAQPSLEPCPLLLWLHPTICRTFIFRVSNEVECLDQQMWFTELMLANKSGREDWLHVSIVDYRRVQEVTMF
jgi:hypothetical protein